MKKLTAEKFLKIAQGLTPSFPGMVVPKTEIEITELLVESAKNGDVDDLDSLIYNIRHYFSPDLKLALFFGCSEGTGFLADEIAENYHLDAPCIYAPWQHEGISLEQAWDDFRAECKKNKWQWRAF